MKDEISREALLIYLNDLRTLETILHESNAEIDKIAKRSDELKSDYCEFEDNRPIKPDMNKPVAPVISKFSPHRSARDIMLLILFPFSFILLVCCIVTFSETGGLFFVLGLVAILPFLLFIPIFVRYVYFFFIGDKKDLEAKYRIALCQYKLNSEKYDDAQEKYQTEYSVYMENCKKEKQNLESKLCDGNKYTEEIKADINEVTEQLQQAYSANIIPLQFRNIQGIYYLYDYISTSNQGLSEAFMQCNLEAIKEKIDNVIKVQSENIIMQAKANAALYEQNKLMLNSLQNLNSKADDITSNTFVAAKYAQISATNSAVALKLQSETFAYQAADFWLKG